MKRIRDKIIVGFLFLAGLSLLLYPYIANEWNNYRQKQLISSYERKINEASIDEQVDYQLEWDKANAYNESLLPSILPDSFAIAEARKEEDEEYLSCLNLTKDGMMGYIEIPKIDIKLPIFHGTSEEVLEKAAGHLEGSSLPVGGKDTHAVISAHRGLPSAALFTDLDRLEEGDHFLLHILDEILCYEVDQISVVDPYDTDGLAVVDGEDLVTLFTCTPYGVNSHRLLVRGHRVPYESELAEQVQNEEAGNAILGTSLHTNYLLWVVVGLAVTALFVVIMITLERRKRKQREHEEDSQEE